LNRENDKMIQLKRILFGSLAILLTLSATPRTAEAVTANTSEYAPRPAKDGRTVYLHGDFTKNGTDTSIIVIPAGQNTKSQTVAVGANTHSAVGGWDSIEMDCFNPAFGYYRTTLRLQGGILYQFKMEQKNSAGIKDTWYGLDGYMSRFDTDSFNGGGDNNINLFLAHDDDVTFFFIDGDRHSFVEWQPAPPHQEYNQPGTKLHLISVSTKIRNNLQGLHTSSGTNNIFDNFSGGAWRWRDAFSPVWYSLTELPESGEITKAGASLTATGALYMFRRTDVGEIGMYGDWQLDNHIANPAQDENSDYWRSAGSFFSRPENAPTLRVTDPTGADASFPLPYAADEKQPRHEPNANNIIFEGNAAIEAAGVYTYYIDDLNLDGTPTDDAQNFILSPRAPAQSIFLPSIAMHPVVTDGDMRTTHLSGQVFGPNRQEADANAVYILLTAAEPENAAQLTESGFMQNGDDYQKLYETNADTQGLWQLPLSLPSGAYTALAFADVFTAQLIDPLSRNFAKELYEIPNTDGINDLNTETNYAGQPYLKDFIAAKNADNLYAAFDGTLVAPGSRIYEVDATGKPTAIGFGFDTQNVSASAAGTHTRSTVVSDSFAVHFADTPAPDVSDDAADTDLPTPPEDNTDLPDTPDGEDTDLPEAPDDSLPEAADGTAPVSPTEAPINETTPPDKTDATNTSPPQEGDEGPSGETESSDTPAPAETDDLIHLPEANSPGGLHPNPQTGDIAPLAWRSIGLAVCMTGLLVAMRRMKLD